MRHTLSLLLGLALAPVIWICATLGAVRVEETFVLLRPASENLGSTLIGVALLAAAGLALGALLGTRLSPVGPAGTGLVFLAAGGVHLFDPKILVDLAPSLGVSAPVVWVIPAGFGWSWMAGFALLVPLVVPSRWRRSLAAAPAPTPPAAEGRDAGEAFAPGQPPGFPRSGSYPPPGDVSAPAAQFGTPPFAPTTPAGFPAYRQGVDDRSRGPGGPSGRFGEPASRPGEPPRGGTPSGPRHPASPEPVSWFDRPDNDPPAPPRDGPPWQDPPPRTDPRRPWEEGDDPEATRRLS